MSSKNTGSIVPLVVVCFSALFIGLIMVLFLSKPNTDVIELSGALILMALTFFGLPYAISKW